MFWSCKSLVFFVVMFAWLQTGWAGVKEEVHHKTYFRDYVQGELIYENALSGPGDVAGFVLEGQAKITFPNGRMRMQNVLPASEGQRANFVFWCDQNFPDGIAISWDFWPVSKIGLALMFFSATGKGGESVLDPGLAPRTGEYPQYHHGDINTLHMAYYRRRKVKNISFHTIHLRKSYGHALVKESADPIPTAADAVSPYKIRLVKLGPVVELFIDELPVMKWEDKSGRPLRSGWIGFRQMAPLIAEYANFKIHRVQEK